MKKGVILFLILFSFIFVSGVYGLSSNIIDYGITEEDSSTSLCFPGGLQSCSIYNYASNTQLLIGDSVGDDMDDLIINLEYHPQDNPSSSCFNSIGSNSGAVEQVRIKYPISSGVECNVLLTNNGGRVCCPVLYVLSVTKSGSGTITSNPSGINCGTTCSASYASGTSVTLTATPASGYYLSAWGGCDSTSGNTCTVSMTGAKSVSVNFAQTTTSYFLSVDKYIGNNKNGIGGAVTSTSNPTQTNQINMPSSSTLTGMSVSYNSGTSVTLTATASSGYVFSGWSGCTSTSENVCTVSITSTKYVNATFNVAPPNNYQLSVTKSGSGTGSVVSDSGGINCGTTCSASYQANTLVKLTATAASGSSFAGWSDPACSRIDPCYVTMNQAKTIIATFTLNPPTCVDKDGDGYFSTSTTCSKYENPVCDLDSISDVTAENGIKCDLLKIELCHTKIVNFQIVESTCIKKLANGDICNIVNGDCIKTDGTSYNNGQGCPAQQTTVNIDSSTKVENYALTSDIINANVYCQSPLNDICQRDNNFNGIWDYAACSFCKNPGRTEICDNIDNNCDGTIDNNCVKNCVDRDGDGYNSSMSGGSVYSLSKCGKMDCKDNSANDPAVCANIGTDLAPKSSACTSLTYAECSYCINPGRTRQVCGVDAKCAGWEFNNGVLRQVTNTALLPQGYVKNSVNEWVFNGYSISSGNWMVCADDGQCVISGEYLASQPQENLGTTQTAERYHYEQIKFIPGGVMSSTGRYGEDWWSPSAKTTGAGKDAQCHYTNMDVVRISASGKDSLESLYGYDCLFPVNNGVYYLCVKQWQSSPFNSISCMPTAEDKPTNGIGTSINSRYGEFGIDGFNQFISQARVKAIVANSSSSWRWSESCVKKDKCKDGANNYGLTNLWDVPYVSENVEKMSVEFKDKVKTSADSTFLVRLRDMDVPGSCRANCVDQDKDQFCANSKMFPDCVDTSVFSTRDPSLYEAQKAIISKKCSDVSEIDFLKEGAPSLKDIF